MQALATGIPNHMRKGSCLFQLYSANDGACNPTARACSWASKLQSRMPRYGEACVEGLTGVIDRMLSLRMHCGSLQSVEVVRRFDLRVYVLYRACHAQVHPLKCL